MNTMMRPLRQGIVIMGVSGCGKTTVAKALSKKLGSSFLDADYFHSNHNMEKMKSGIPLEDEDRWEWLDVTARAFGDAIATNPNAVLACSALKASYRLRIERNLDDKPNWILLDGSRELLLKRLSMRPDHFFDPKLLDSQLMTLEKPEDAHTMDIEHDVDMIVGELFDRLMKTDLNS